MSSDNQVLESQLIQSIVDNFKHGKTKYAFLLGAGASVSSGIPLAKDLAERWFDELKTSHLEVYKSIADEVSKSIADEVSKSIADEVSKSIAAEVVKGQIFSRLYSKIYSKRFENFSDDGYSAIEKIITNPNVTPSIGYTFLADILIRTHNNVVLTTNFDRLTETELLTVFERHTNVIYHELALPFLKLNDQGPIILKIHNDVFAKPISNPDKENLLTAWESELNKILDIYDLIVLGYGGNPDERLAQFLFNKKSEQQQKIYWCYIDEPNLPDNNFRYTQISNFDDFFSELNDALPDTQSNKLEDLQRRITKTANKKIQKITQEITRIDTRKSNKVIERLIKFAANTWSEYQIKINYTESINEKETLYNEGLEKFPNSTELMGNYAVFLTFSKKNYTEAEIYYLKALKIDPANEYINGHYAGFLLATNRKEEAIPYLEIAEKTSYQDELKLELHFYRLAHFREDYAKSKSAISELLKKGVRSIGWNFDANIERAEQDGFTKVDELRKIAKDITIEAPTIK